MILNKDQLLVIKLNADTLLQIGVTEALGTLCLECATPIFVERKMGVFLCGYCGAGPFEAEDSPFWLYPARRLVQHTRAWFRRRRNCRPEAE